MVKINPKTLHKLVKDEVYKALKNPMPEGAVCSVPGEVVVDLTGAKNLTQASLAILDAGGSDEIVPPKDLVDKVLAWPSGSVRVVGKTWIGMRDKRGATLYHFGVPVKIKA